MFGNMDETNDVAVKVLDRCRVSPPPSSLSSTSLPLTFFDIPWLLCPSMQRLFFYQNPSINTNHFIQTVFPSLKNSLSLTLQHFFPFAANLVCPSHPHKPHIVYADGDSLSLTLAESAADFYHLVADYPRDVKDLHPLLPELPLARALADGTRVVPLMAIQVTLLPPSAFSIGITFRHVAADGRAFNNFMKSWASICRTGGLTEESTPFHNRAEAIKDSNGLEQNFLNEWWNCVTEWNDDRGPARNIPGDKVRATILLGPAQIQRLKHWASIQSDAPHISTFVLTCALVWVCMVKSDEESKFNSWGSDELCYLVIVADCRNRYEFSIPLTYFGNCLALCFIGLKRRELVGEFGMVEALKAIGNRIKELEEGALRGAERWMVSWKELVEHHLVTVAGSQRLEVYQTDFGWGRPKKSEVVHIDRSGAMSIAESREEEGGVEVGLALPRLQMSKFNNNLQKLLEARIL